MSDYLFSLKGDYLSQAIGQKILGFQNYVLRSGKGSAWSKNRDYYENKFYSNREFIDILDVGEQGELLATACNDYRNVLRHLLSGITSQKYEFTLSSVNSQTTSRRDTDIGKQVLDYYEHVMGYEEVSDKVAEIGIVYGQGFQVEEFNPTIGKVVVDPESGKLRPEGEIESEFISTWDMFYDYTTKKPDWYCFRRRKNKYDISAQFSGEKKDQIEALPPFYTQDLYYKDIQFYGEMKDTDDIYIYSCYKLDSPACEGGKYVMFCGSVDAPIHLYDDVNPYKEKLPVFPFMPEQYIENFFGFSPANILRAPQEMENNALSISLTNLQKSIKSVWCKRGDEVTTEELANGSTLIQSDSKPEPIEMHTAADEGLLNFIKFCNDKMEILSAQNAVVRGSVQDAPNLKSGIAIQTVAAMGQQYIYGAQKAFKKMKEAVYNFRLYILQNAADTERLVTIVGENERQNVMKFTKEDIKGIQRVLVQDTNPILNSPAGRIEIGQNLLQLGIIDKYEFLDIVNYGNLGEHTKNKLASRQYGLQVKEALLQGRPVDAIMGADHPEVLKIVQPLLLDIDYTHDPKNATIMSNIMAFITSTMKLMGSGDQLSALIYGGVAPQPIMDKGMPVPPQAPGVMGGGQAGTPPVVKNASPNAPGGNHGS